MGHLLDVDGLGRALAVLVARVPLLGGHLAFKANLEVDKSYICANYTLYTGRFF